jgi:hypothetical protein
MSSAIQQALTYNFQAFFGYPDFSHKSVLNFSNPSGLTSSFNVELTVELEANEASVYTFNPTIYPNFTDIILFALYDVTSPPQSFIAYTGSNNQFLVSPGGIFAATPTGLFQTIYIVNPNTTPGLLQIAFANS